MIDELEDASNQLLKGTKLAGKKLEALYDRAKGSLVDAGSGDKGNRG
ncbi:MAG TPA: hypothetical protein VFX59_18520 [Polyangiales bacterium]|nr:hypothetical protein [Polyangiales bacterium]